MRWEWMLPLALILAIWAGICVSIASLSGWSKLAVRFPAEREPLDGSWFRWQYMSIGWCDYNGCTTFCTSPDGLYISIWPIFVGHPALLIPWNEIRFVEERRFLGFVQAKCEIGTPMMFKLHVPIKVFDAGREWMKPKELP